MLPDHPADYRTLLWTLVFTPALAVAHFLRPDLSWYLFPLSMYFAVSCAVIAHNHIHRPTLRGRTPNLIFSHWISIFYGYPVFGWMPTHNLNHHRYLNKHGDATITWRITNRHHVLVAASYFFVSAFHQGRWIGDFLRQSRERNPALYRRLLLQYVSCYGVHAMAIGVAIYALGIYQGLGTYLLALGIPAVFALWTVMLFNYEQHVHTDPWSRRNHSRNFVSPVLNFLLFGNGYHTVHHDDAKLHWAEARKAHEAIEREIDPRLCEPSMWWYFFRQYFLASFVPSLGTTQIGRAPFDAPETERQADAPETFDVSSGGRGLAEGQI